MRVWISRRAVNTFAPFGNGHLIPRGSLREPPAHALQRVDVAVLHNFDLATEDERHEAERAVREVAPAALPVLWSSFVPTRLVRYAASAQPVEEPLDLLSTHAASYVHTAESE